MSGPAPRHQDRRFFFRGFGVGMGDGRGMGGRDDATAEAEGNLALLMPSRLWPGDHFAILAMMTFGIDAPGAAISGGVATDQGAAVAADGATRAEA